MTYRGGPIGYLFEHHDIAASLGRDMGADWILVGRLHKPNFLFAYLMAHLVETETGRLVGNYVVEVKGPQLQVTKKGVRRLAEKINSSIKATERRTGAAASATQARMGG